MNVTMRRVILGGTLATVLVGGIGLAVATAHPASAQVMGPGTRMAPGAMHAGGPAGARFGQGRGMADAQAPMFRAGADWMPGAGAPWFQGDDARMPGRRAPVGGPDIPGVVAKAIGLTEAQLAEELDGKSLAAVVEAHGGDLAAVKAAILAEVQAKLDAAVQAGTVTAERAATMTTSFATRVDAMLAQVHDRDGWHRGGPWRDDVASDDDRRGPGMGDRGGRRGGGPRAPSAQLPEVGETQS